MSPSFHKFWLKITAVIVGSFAPVFFLGSMTATSEPARFTLDLISWPLDGATSWSAPELRLLSALAGGFLLGWGVLIWRLATDLYDIAPEAVRQSVVVSLLAWFVLDSAGSVLSGNAVNVILNSVLLIVAVGPLWRPAARESAAR